MGWVFFIAGWGPAPPPLGPVSELVEEILGAENVVLSGVLGGIDSSMLQLLNTTENSVR